MLFPVPTTGNYSDAAQEPRRCSATNGSGENVCRSVPCNGAQIASALITVITAHARIICYGFPLPVTTIVCQISSNELCRTTR